MDRSPVIPAIQCAECGSENVPSSNQVFDLLTYERFQRVPEPLKDLFFRDRFGRNQTEDLGTQRSRNWCGLTQLVTRTDRFEVQLACDQVTNAPRRTQFPLTSSP